MKLQTLLQHTQVIALTGSDAIDITSITEDSRTAVTGSLFVAIKGVTGDGGRFVDVALANGAVAVISEDLAPGDCDAVWIQVANSRIAVAQVAAELYQHPSQQMKVVGITGTNGKTTVSFIVRNMLTHAGISCGIVGTVAYGFKEIQEASRTTPDAVFMQQLLHDMHEQGAQAAALEVSSHALDQHRVDGIAFDVGVFTNLTQDHLDYHQVMEKYRDAKMRLFLELLEQKPNTRAIINIDDDEGAYIVEQAQVRCLTYGIEKHADLQAVNLELDTHQTRFEVVYLGKSYECVSELLGRHNVYNCLAALGTGVSLGLDFETLQQALSLIKHVPGRLQRIPNKHGFQVFVDYAHTDDALKNVLSTVREITPGRLICVFGCGGDRDQDKRPLMGKVAHDLADYSIITSDNPRTEDPEAIIEQVEQGFSEHVDRYMVQVDRRDAIFDALSEAQPGDAVLIAGKGHENYQIFKDRTIHFDDCEVVREYFNE